MGADRGIRAIKNINFGQSLVNLPLCLIFPGFYKIQINAAVAGWTPCQLMTPPHLALLNIKRTLGAFRMTLILFWERRCKFLHCSHGKRFSKAAVKMEHLYECKKNVGHWRASYGGWLMWG